MENQVTNNEVSLEYTVGSSFKFYKGKIIQLKEGFQACFEYGRIGSTRNQTLKPEKPTTMNKAMTSYINQIRSKIRKGYKIKSCQGYDFRND